MIIREAAKEDLPGMLEIYNEAIRTLTATFDLEEQSLEERKAWFKKYGGKYPLTVAEEDGQIAGYCSIGPFRDKQAYEKTAELSVYISSRFRGKGIGTGLVEDMLSRAGSLGYHTIISGLTAGNAASVKLHERLGFRYIGIFKEVGFKFGEWQDVLFYQYFFDA
jgi:L-amino acid N-acyltransferase